jgi:hypothetical protein
MIIFELICSRHHRFEGWFSSHDDFARQKETHALACPVCATTRIEKLPIANVKKSDSVANAKKSDSTATDIVPTGVPNNQTPQQNVELALSQLIEQVLRHTEDVGAAFPVEARKIHYQEAPARGIRGIANRAEVEGLLDEGIEVVPLPIPSRGDLH